MLPTRIIKSAVNISADKSAQSVEKSVKVADKFTQSAENLTPSADKDSADKAAENCEDGDCLPTPPRFSTFRWRRRSTASHIIFKTRLLICRRFR